MSVKKSESVGSRNSKKRENTVNSEKWKDEIKVEVFEAKIKHAFSFRVLSAYDNFFAFSY
jgi:hypothetical protein